MKSILLITHVRFWKHGAGNMTRIASLIYYLQKVSFITVLFIGIADENDILIIDDKFKDLEICFLERSKLLAQDDYIKRFDLFILERFFDIAIFEYIDLYPLLEHLPANTISILDTHDILSQKISTFRKHNLKYEGHSLSFGQEIKIFAEFDFVILISSRDFELISKYMPKEKLLLLPHPVSFPQIVTRKNVKIISFVASEYLPNVDSIEWFIEQVWPAFVSRGIILNVIGNVVEKIRKSCFDNSNINFMGFVDDLSEVYNQSDIVINPVRAGAGLKIKNIEALGHGIPLVTTLHGLSGIEGALPESVIVANTAAEFISSLDRLITDFNFRKSLSDNSYNFANIFYSENACFSPIVSLL